MGAYTQLSGKAGKAQKSLLEGGGYTYEELFSVQDALDADPSAIIGIKTETRTGNKGTIQNMYAQPGGTAANLGSILGQTDAIAAFKKRKLEQQKMTQAGVGTQQSILGGGAF